jgi:hypothetical protein
VILTINGNDNKYDDDNNNNNNNNNNNVSVSYEGEVSDHFEELSERRNITDEFTSCILRIM